MRKGSWVKHSIFVTWFDFVYRKPYDRETNKKCFSVVTSKKLHCFWHFSKIDFFKFRDKISSKNIFKLFKKHKIEKNLCDWHKLELKIRMVLRFIRFTALSTRFINCANVKLSTFFRIFKFKLLSYYHWICLVTAFYKVSCQKFNW